MQELVQQLNEALEKLCGFPGVQVLIISRSHVAFGGAKHVLLTPLGRGAATELLQDRCGEAAWDSSAAAPLSQMCGGNALCLCIVGSFITSGALHFAGNQGHCFLEFCASALMLQEG